MLVTPPMPRCRMPPPCYYATPPPRFAFAAPCCWRHFTLLSACYADYAELLAPLYAYLRQIDYAPLFDVYDAVFSFIATLRYVMLLLRR